MNTGVSSEHWNYQISEVLIDGDAYFHIAIYTSGIRNVTLMCLSLCICKILLFLFSIVFLEYKFPMLVSQQGESPNRRGVLYCTHYVDKDTALKMARRPQI